MLYPGGCDIGSRPIDLHIRSLETLGYTFSDVEYGSLYAKAVNLSAKELYLDYPSVGATENIILSTVFIPGTTSVVNVAREPEIVDLQRYLNACGAKISGAGTDIITIEGVEAFSKFVQHTIVPDRIEASTYLIAAAMTNGDLLIRNIVPEHISSLTSLVRESGCKIDAFASSIRIVCKEKLHSIETVRTQPYPGFPTDVQAQMMAMLTISRGTSVIYETVFENRFKHIGELRKMGAKIKQDGRIAIITGINSLNGACVTSCDLRGGAALILAGLAANGETIVEDKFHIERGYERIVEKFTSVGATIRMIQEIDGINSV